MNESEISRQIDRESEWLLTHKLMLFISNNKIDELSKVKVDFDKN